MLALWIALRIYEAFLDVSNVAVFAHLGGAIVGIAFWWLTQRTVHKG